MNEQDAFADITPEFESFEFEAADWDDGSEVFGQADVFDEAELMELAGELLTVGSEADLDQFIGRVVRRAGRRVRRAVRSPVGRAIGGHLKGAARRALPIAGAALGAKFGGPVGARIGRGLATAAGSALGLEAELLSPEDQEFEGAKQFVRIGGQAVREALQAPADADPTAAAQQAVTNAVMELAPGLLQGRAPRLPQATSSNSGRWVRQGRNVLLINV
ncbi:MAG: hypothetical protein EA400_17215 [Chromatiaceae bacterium]|nr:MAG: hypothetical protein EA400_17215 [Chromatiaceae bacterium]